MHGAVLKRRGGGKGWVWSERYMLLNNNMLYLFRRREDSTPHRTIVLTARCNIASEVVESKKVYEQGGFRKKKKGHSMQENSNPEEEQVEPKSKFWIFRLEFSHARRDKSPNNFGSFSEKTTTGERDSFISATGTDTESIYNSDNERVGKDGKEKVREAYLEFGVISKEVAEMWKEKIDEAISTESSVGPPAEKKYGITPGPIKQLLHIYSDKAKHREGAEEEGGLRKRGEFSSQNGILKDQTTFEETVFQSKTDKLFGDWEALRVQDGVTIQIDDPSFQRNSLQKNVHDLELMQKIFVGFFPLFFVFQNYFGTVYGVILSLSVCGLLFWFHEMPLLLAMDTTLRASSVVEARADEVMKVLLNDNLAAWSSSINCCDVIQDLDEHTTIYRIVYMSLRWWKFWSRPRDVCMMRYWRREEDGSYMMIMQSVEHPGCPPHPGFVRTKLSGSAIVVSPEVNSKSRDRSLVTFMVRFDPEGWRVPFYFMHRPVEYILPQLVDCIALRDFMSALNFRSGSGEERHLGDDVSQLELQTVEVDWRGMVVGVKKLPSAIEERFYGEPAASNFMVRGATYLEDAVKIPSAPAPFHLVCLDNLSFEDPAERYNLCNRPDNIIYQLNHEANEKGEKAPFTFVVNFIVPCKDNLAVTCYFQPSKSDWEQDYPQFAELLEDFIEGDDEFRNNRFKLVPVIVEGNFVLKKAVNRPAIIGNKGVRVPYARGNNWFEVDIDVDSDRTARQLTGMVQGVTKTLVVDIGFVIESKTEEELPECILGCARFNKIDLGKFKYITKGSGGSDAPTERLRAKSISSQNRKSGHY